MPKQPPIPSTPGYRIVDRRGEQSRWLSSSQPNKMIAGATQNASRSKIPALDQDTHRNVSNMGRRTLMTLGRWLFWNFPAVSGAILEQAMYASENFQPQFWGRDKAWGDRATEWLLNWEQIADIQGWPYDMAAFRNNLIVSELRDGDVAVLLTSEGGIPKIQVWPAHRIGSATGENVVTDGPYDGARICDGVILNEYRRPIAYRLLDENGDTVQDVSTFNMHMAFIPKAPDQVRGFSALASAVFDWQDIKESRYYELIAQKAASAVALIEENETGDVDPADGIINTAATFDSSTGNKTALDTQEIAGGTYRYFKAGTNSKLQAFSYDRPGSSVQQYQETIIRDAFQGMEWSYFFSHDPSKIGGASMRVVVEKINRVIRKRQRLISQVMRRVHGYAVSIAMKNGELPWNDDWYKWDYQLAAQITADKRYDSDVDIQDYENHFITLQDACAKRGQYWEDVQDQWLLEKKRLQEKAAAMGVDLTSGTDAAPAPGAEPEEPEGAEEEDSNEPDDD